MEEVLVRLLALIERLITLATAIILYTLAKAKKKEDLDDQDEK